MINLILSCDTPVFTITDYRDWILRYCGWEEKNAVHGKL